MLASRPPRYFCEAVLVVCSRTKEYLDQPGRFSSLHTVVSIQPLSPQQIEDYLSTLGEDASGLKRALHESEVLRALVVTPLLLKVFILAYLDKSEQEVLQQIETVSAKDRQHVLFHDYIERMLQRKEKRIHAPAQQTKCWLAWLAGQLTEHQQNELYLEYLQPDWHPERRRFIYRWSVRLVGMLFYGLGVVLAFGLVEGQFVVLANWPLVRLLTVPSSVLGSWLLLVLIGGWALWKSSALQQIKPVEAVSWSWRDARSKLLTGLVLGLVLGLVSGLLIGLYTRRLDAGLLYVLLYGLFVGLLVGLVGVLYSVFAGKMLPKDLHLSPNEGIRRTAKYGLFFGLVAGLVGGLVAGLVGGLFFGLVGGLFAAIQHSVLRLWLWQAKCTSAPWRYVAFLDDAVDQQLLRRVGGGYIFRHRLLQDYFASLETRRLPDGKTSQAPQIPLSPE